MNNLENICTTFFYWWYNQKGCNTEQGFRDWSNKTEEGKEAMAYINELKEKSEKWDALNQTHSKKQ